LPVQILSSKADQIRADSLQTGVEGTGTVDSKLCRTSQQSWPEVAYAERTRGARRAIYERLVWVAGRRSAAKFTSMPSVHTPRPLPIATISRFLRFLRSMMFPSGPPSSMCQQCSCGNVANSTSTRDRAGQCGRAALKAGRFALGLLADCPRCGPTRFCWVGSTVESLPVC